MPAAPLHLDLGGYRYVLTHAKARETLQVCARLGNASAALFEGLAHGRGSQRLANAVVYLMSSPALGPTLEYVVNTFAPYTQVVVLETGKSMSLAEVLDLHFAGRMGDFAKWIEAAIEYECGDFLGEQIARFLDGLAEAVKPSSDSPPPNPAATSG